MSRIFLSCVTEEFGAYRAQLAGYLRRANCLARFQEDFPQVPRPTLHKLDEEIRQCDAVVHVLGEQLGAVPTREAVDDFYREVPEFGAKVPKEVAYGLTYTQWEAYLAACRGKDLFVYRICKAIPRPDPHYEHFMRVKGLMSRPTTGYAERCDDVQDHLGKLIGDLRQFAPALKQALKPNNLPFRSLGSLFKGRGQFLNALRVKLESAGSHATAITSKPQALHGTGGVGKTRAAIEYAWKHHDDYTALLFITADSPTALETNLAELVGVVGIAGMDSADDPTRLRAVLAWLKTHPGWLAILDNVDTEPAAQAVRARLADLNSGQLIITTRISEWTASVTALEMDVLDMESARDYLLEATSRRRFKDDDMSAAEKVARDVGQLALGLEHVAAYVNARRLTLRAYADLWSSRQAEILRTFGKQRVEYPREILVTWHLSTEQLSEAARCLLDILCWFAPEPIPETLLEAAPEGLATEEPLEALAELEKYSLVRRDRNTPVFTVHRLVQATTRYHQRRADDTAAIHHLGVALRWLDGAMAGDPQDVRTWPKLEPLQPHADAVCDSATELGMESADYPTARVLTYAGLLHQHKARFGEAESRLRRGLSIDERAYGCEHPRVASHLNNLASLLQATNRLAEAEPLMLRALSIDERAYGPEHPEVATNLNNLAQLLKAKNRLAEAEPLMRRALSIDERAYGPEHPGVATNLNNLAQLLLSTGRLAEAEPLMRRALSIDERAYGPQYPKVAIYLNNLALLLKETNRLAEAEPLMRRALSIVERAYGPEHPEVAPNLNNLASVLQATNRLVEAEPLVRRALSIDERAYGPEHPRVATYLNNLALLLKETNRLAEAEPLMRRALSIDESAYGPEHPTIAVDLNKLALLLRETNRLAEAEPLMRRALRIKENACGPEHPTVAVDLNNLALLLRETNRLAEAQPLMRRALGIEESAYGPEDSRVATYLNNLAQLLKETNHLAEAEPLLKRSVRILAAVGRQAGHEHPSMQAASANYSSLLEAMGYTRDQVDVCLAEAMADAADREPDDA